MHQTFNQHLQNLLQNSDSLDHTLSNLVSLLGETLQCDRCFLYLRDPLNQLGKVTHCWRRSPNIPVISDPDWKPEPPSLPQDDPLFAAALKAEPSVFVEDVATADPSVVNRKFEQENFGHQALIHAHLRQDGLLWGILQPCIFGSARHWTDTDRAIMSQVESAITPLAIAYIKAANP